jgi:hypothetical protein
MEQFYLGLRAGQAPGAALRAAQGALLAERAHPYLWAPFQLVGYGGPPRRRAALATPDPSGNVRGRAAGG